MDLKQTAFIQPLMGIRVCKLDYINIRMYTFVYHAYNKFCIKWDLNKLQLLILEKITSVEHLRKYKQNIFKAIGVRYVLSVQD